MDTIIEARMFDGVKVQLEIDKLRAKENAGKSKKTESVPYFVIRPLRVSEWYALSKLSISKLKDGEENEGWDKIKEDFNKVGFSLVDVEGLTHNGEPVSIEHETVGIGIGKYKRVPVEWIDKYLHIDQFMELLNVINAINSPSKQERDSVNFTLKQLNTGLGITVKTILVNVVVKERQLHIMERQLQQDVSGNEYEIQN